jgi:hypothetical protein
MDLFKKMHDALCDPEPVTSVAQTPPPKPPPSRLPSNFVQPVASDTTFSDSNAGGVLFDQLKVKTDFELTPVGKAIKEHLMTVQGLGLSPASEMVAVLRGGAKDGITADSIISTLQGLKDVLLKEQTAFMAQADNATKNEVDTRMDKIARETEHQTDLQRQLAESQQIAAQLANEITEKKTTISSMINQFNTAFTARNIELDTQISHYNSILIPATAVAQGQK